MRINEVIGQVDLSKRAIKYYEEEGLLEVSKDENGYRNYSENDIQLLKEISVYRKLGISIKDIKILLADKDKQLLKKIYLEKNVALESSQKELSALKHFIEDHNVDEIYDSVDYKNIGTAIQEMLPGFYGYYFMNHFMPYLQIQITTPQQKEAYEKIIQFWDNAQIKIPLFLKFSGLIMYKTAKTDMQKMVEQLDRQMQTYLNPSDEEYQKLLTQTKNGVKTKNSLFYKYHPVFVSQRKFMRRLQDCGYNDIFIPNMMALSPKYKAYHDALDQINHRICQDLNLYYDSRFNLKTGNKSGKK